MRVARRQDPCNSLFQDSTTTIEWPCTLAMTKNLVMGFATNQNDHSLRVFIKSLRRVYSQTECDVVIITNRYESYFRDLSSQTGVIFVSTPNNYSTKTGHLSKT